MRRVVNLSAYWKWVAIVTFILAMGWGRDGLVPAQAEVASVPLSSGGLITHFHEETNPKLTRVVIVDPLQRRMAVYHIEANGAIQLKSVRNLTVDLQVQEFNSDNPSPVDMQQALQRN